MKDNKLIEFKINEDLVYQDNAITCSRFKFSNLEHKLRYLLQSKLKKDDPPNKKYRLSLREIKEYSEKDIDHIHFKKHVKRLLEKVFEVEEKNKKFIKIALLNSVKYITGRGEIEVELSKEMRKYFFGLKNRFTTLNWKLAMKLPGEHIPRFYDLISQYKDTGIRIEELKSLKYKFCLENCYKRDDDFIKRVIKPAKEEIEKISEIYFDYEVHKSKKTGNVYFVFKIKRKNKNNDYKKPRKSNIKENNKELSKEELSCYLFLTKETKWLSKKIAFKLVKKIELYKIYDLINDLKVKIINGELVEAPTFYFEKELN